MPPDDRELLKSEYLHIQNVIESFDGRALLIKAWSITFGLAAIGAAYNTESWLILILAAMGPTAF